MRIEINEDGKLDFTKTKKQVVEKVKKEKAKKRLDLFKDILANILGGKGELNLTDIEKSHVPYVINRCLANIDKYMPLISMLNRYGGSIPPVAHYRLLYRVIQPKRKRFTGYLKEGTLEKEVNTISEYFDMNKDVIKSYLKLWTTEEITEILEDINNAKSST